MDNHTVSKNGYVAINNSDNLEEKKPLPERIIQEITKRSHLTKLENSFAGLYYSWMPLFFINSAVIFFRFQSELLDVLNRKLRYFFTIEAEARKAVSFDGAILAAEALGLTTPLMAVILPTLTFMAAYRFRQYYSTKKLTNHLVQELKKRKFPDPAVFKYSAFKYIDADKEKLEELISIVKQDSDIEPSALTDNELKEILSKVKEIPTSRSRWEKFAEYMQWYTTELSPYVWTAVELSYFVGFGIFRHHLIPLAEKLNCSMWSLITDDCPEQYDLMALTIYVWIAATVTYLASYALGVLARLALSPPLLSGIRNNIYENKYRKKISAWWNNEDNWVYRNPIKIKIMAICLTTAIGIAFYRAVKFANRTAASYYCPPVDQIAWSFIRRDFSYDSVCTAIQRLNIMTGLLGALEICKGYFAYYVLNKISFAVFLAVACSSYYKQNERREEAKEFNRKWEAVSYISKMIALLGIFIAGTYSSAGISPGLIASISAEGISNTYYSPNGTSPFSNMTGPVNPIMPSYSFNNVTSMLTVITAKPCPGYGVLGLLGANLVHKSVDCDQDLLVRLYQSIGVPFWMSISFTGGLAFSLSCLVLSVVIFKCYSNRATIKTDTGHNIPNPEVGGGINNSDVKSNRWTFFKDWCSGKKEERLLSTPENSCASFCC